MTRSPTSDLALVHRLLCSPLVDESLYRLALGGGRADLSTVARYLRTPVAERPALSPYFDAAFYRALNPALSADADPLLDFLGRGLAGWRDPHPLVDLHHIARLDPALLGPQPTDAALAEVLACDLVEPSAYFDLRFYATQLETPVQGMLRHFLETGLAGGLLPNRWLDPVWYARSYPDAPRDRMGALRHFVLNGDPLGRAAGPAFDGAFYQRRYTDVADSGFPPLWHFLSYGRAEGRQAPSDRAPGPRPAAADGAQAGRQTGAPALEPAVAGARVAIGDAGTLRHTHAVLRRRWDDLLHQDKQDVRVESPPLVTSRDHVADLARLRLPAHAAPRLSILVPAFNEAAHTVACLLAVAADPPSCPFEVVLADDGSTEAAYRAMGAVANLVHVRGARNQGFILTCNAAWRRCRGALVLLLNNDAQPLAGGIDRLVAALDADPAVAAAGPMLLYPDGRLQEAGCYLRPDGESGMVGLFADPDDPRYGYDRDVAYCSGAALLLRRAAVGETLFDEAYLPAYCEDADLCLRLRALGHRVRYVAGARFVHHLSATTNRARADRKHRGILRNQATLQARWAEALADMDRVRPIAFYLPQFHPTPENDFWWGAGFSEWTNVARARPSYAGHYQPHLPADLGFYDLRLPDALRRQAALARRYGVEGFCVYHYDFGDRRALDTPMAVLHAHPDIDFRHCLCWANENWSRNWDGGTREVLAEQRHDAATLARVIADAVAHARDPRYITVHGRPLFLVYRPLQLPDAQGFARDMRAAFAASGFPGVHLVYVESMEAVDRGLCPADFGFDAAVEFPPHGRAVPATDSATIVKQGWAGYRYDYAETVFAFLRREGVAYPRYPCVFPSWDNTPRQPERGTSFDGAAPEVFRFYVERKIEAMRGFLTGDERLLFVNAWNEWAEGAHLEPDSGYGHGWLEALRDALAARSWR